MASRIKLRGPTWQCPEWRRHLLASADPNDRARMALIRIEEASRLRPPETLSYSLARMTAPFFGDDTSVGGAFSIRPAFRGFA